MIWRTALRQAKLSLARMVLRTGLARAVSPGQESWQGRGQLEREARWRRAAGRMLLRSGRDSRSSPRAQLCLPFQEHLLFICFRSALSPGFLGTELPSLSFGELVGKFSAAPWGRVTCELVFTVFFPFLSLHPHSFLLSSLPLSRFLLSLVVVVAVAVQLRWQAVRLSLHYQRVARQRLSHLKWKAEQRLRVMTPSWEPALRVGPRGQSRALGIRALPVATDRDSLVPSPCRELPRAAG